jgi:FecR protein
MNRTSNTFASCLIAGAVFFIGYAIAANSPKKEARVTQIIRDVQLLPVGDTPRPALQDDQVTENTGVRTGDESRSELTFEDLTITRLGANTIFSFDKAGRRGELESGSILLRVPKNSGGAEFRTRAVTVGITGTTVILESTRLGNANLIVLEGDARMRLVKYPKEFKNVRAGQMLNVQADAAKLPAPEEVDLDQVRKTHPLLTDFPPLPSDDLIRTAIKKQRGGGFGPVTSTPTPAPPLTPTGPIGVNPLPRPTFTPRNFPTRTPTPTPTLTPTRTPPKPPGTSDSPTATPTPRKVPIRPPKGPRKTPTPTPAPILRRTIPPAQGGQTQIPKKKGIRRVTPTPTPVIIR